jgi:hypothetical protein
MSTGDMVGIISLVLTIILGVAAIGVSYALDRRARKSADRAERALVNVNALIRSLVGLSESGFGELREDLRELSASIPIFAAREGKEGAPLKALGNSTGEEEMMRVVDISDSILRELLPAAKSAGALQSGIGANIEVGDFLSTLFRLRSRGVLGWEDAQLTPETKVHLRSR